MNYEAIRKAGKQTINGNTYVRQTPLKALLGRKCEVAFTLDVVAVGWYAVIEADALQPSHRGGSQNYMHFIPEAQPRNRAASNSGAMIPDYVAKNLRPFELLMAGTAYAGCPIVNERGEAIQGNGRSYSLILYYSLFPSDPRKYREAIMLEAECLGINDKSIGRMKRPILVRMLKVSDAQAIRLGQYTQSDLEAVSNKTTQVKTRVRRVNNAVRDAIINELLTADKGDGSSVSELVRGSKVIKVLVKKGVMRADEIENYVDKNGNVNADGVKYVADLLTGLLFKSADVNAADAFRTLPYLVQQALEKSSLYLLRVPYRDSINEDVAESVLAARDFFNFNGSFRLWTSQLDITGQSAKDRFSPLALKLVEMYANAKSQRDIIQVFRRYENEVRPSVNSLF